MTDRGEMSIDGSGLDVLVAEILLELGDGDSGLEQMSREAMAKRVSRSRFGNPGTSAGLHDGGLKPSRSHRLPGLSHPATHLLRGSGGASDLRKYPNRITVVEPVSAQLRIHQLAQKRVAVLAAFSFAHDKLVVGPVYVVHAEPNTFADA